MPFILKIISATLYLEINLSQNWNNVRTKTLFHLMDAESENMNVRRPVLIVEKDNVGIVLRDGNGIGLIFLVSQYVEII